MTRYWITVPIPESETIDEIEDDDRELIDESRDELGKLGASYSINEMTYKTSDTEDAKKFVKEAERILEELDKNTELYFGHYQRMTGSFRYIVKLC